MSGGIRIEDIGGGFSVEVSADHGFGTDAYLLAWFAAVRPRQKGPATSAPAAG